MALTYEDMNCAENGEYDRTADAFLEGITDFLGIRESGLATQSGFKAGPDLMSDLTFFPNPAPAGAVRHIQFTLRQPVKLTFRLYDLLGRRISDLARSNHPAGEQIVSLQIPALPQGVYFLQISGPEIRKSVPILILK